MAKQYIPILPALLAIVTAASAQDRARLYSHPALPSSEALARLNLVQSWVALLPTDGPQDSILGIHVLPDQVLVQFRSSSIISLDPTNGRTQWRVRFGIPYRSNVGLGFNDDTVFGYNSLKAFGFDRATGVRLWEFTPAGTAVAAPVADHDQLYLPLLGGELRAYVLRELETTASAPRPSSGAAPSEAEVAAAGKPRFARVVPRGAWTFYLEGRRLEHSPVISSDTVMVATTEGHFLGTHKLAPFKVFDIAVGTLSAPIATYGNISYAVTDEQRVLAVDTATGNVIWRAVTSGLVRRRPMATEQDLYVGTEGTGVYRFDRLTGEQIWFVPDGDAVLAHNRLLTYVTDRSGKLMVIDRARGTVLTRLDVRDFVYPVINEVTDRVYLAANDGTIVCLHDRSLPRPESIRSSTEAPIAPVAPPTRPAAKPTEPAPPR